MRIPEPHQTGILVKRYKRFLADIRLEDNSILTVHCPNTGSMKGCSSPGSPVVISHSDNPKRKYAWTLEMVEENGIWVGVNTSLTNKLVQEGLENQTIDDFGRIDSITREIRVSDNSRLDFLLQTDGGKVFIEVKNCSLVEDGVALFPDAVTARGTRPLLELDRLRKEGHKTALIFCVQRNDAYRFLPAQAIDPVYAETLYRTYKDGLTVLAYQADVQPDQVKIIKKIPVFDTKRD